MCRGVLGFWGLPKGHSLLRFAEFFGDPVMATLIAMIAIFTFGLNRHHTMDEVIDTITDSIPIPSPIGVLRSVGGGQRLQPVLVDSGVEQYIAGLMEGGNVCADLMAWSTQPRCVWRWVPPPWRQSPPAASSHR